jgi:hypothetical protein
MGDDSAEARIREIEGLFMAKGWRLSVSEEDNGEWTAAFWLAPMAGETVSARIAQQASGGTALAAAEAAWAMYQREPWLGGSAPTE